ncbi:hypothetical protein L2E82_44734 [Cichorium intybus]|uniref:Uncharacterized protein n=1 Tax=Cichorium intybus TaxID=13427 RepID=A0ACB8ZQ27_CICIN|nr:hypothetical protein L2E82_44734 [Cichorium intybus]
MVPPSRFTPSVSSIYSFDSNTSRYVLIQTAFSTPASEEPLFRYLTNRTIRSSDHTTTIKVFPLQKQSETTPPSGQQQFSPSSPGWPPFMRVNPILDWSYRYVWAFLLTCKVPYCSLYDQGYTSIRSVNDTTPNTLLRINDSNGEKFKPAFMLSDGRLELVEQKSQLKKSTMESKVRNCIKKTSVQPQSYQWLRFRSVEDQLGHLLCKKLHLIGWNVSRIAVVQSDVDSVAKEVEIGSLQVTLYVFLLVAKDEEMIEAAMEAISTKLSSK